MQWTCRHWSSLQNFLKALHIAQSNPFDARRSVWSSIHVEIPRPHAVPFVSCALLCAGSCTPPGSHVWKFGPGHQAAYQMKTRTGGASRPGICVILRAIGTACVTRAICLRSFTLWHWSETSFTLTTSMMLSCWQPPDILWMHFAMLRGLDRIQPRLLSSEPSVYGS